MDIKTEPITKPSHGFALLKELDLQRRTGTFCDCVIRLHMHHDQLFLAHKSVLAAYSPVFATLLPQHGSFMDLNSPLLTPETLALLLEYMYTGILPPESHEEPVVYAAFHLQMEQLQHALTCRRKEKEITHPVHDQTNRKRGFTEHESVDKTLLSSSSYFSYGSDQPPPSTPSYEVVPVICHLKTSGNNKLPLRSHCLDKTLNVERSGHVSEADKHPQSAQDNVLPDSFFESSQSKHDKTENSANDIPSAVAEEVEKFNSSCKTGQLQSSGTQTIIANSSNTDNKDQCVHSAYTSSKHLSPGPDCRKSEKKCVTGVDCVQSFNPIESEKHVSVPGIVTETLSDKKWRKDCVNAYQGHLRFHCLPQSNDSDSDEACPGPNVDVKDSSEALEMIDMAEILLSTRERLKFGSQNHSKTRRFPCLVPECEKAFSQRGSLNRHMRSHFGIRPYSCPLCTMTFSRQYRVTEHMRIHQRSCDNPP